MSKGRSSGKREWQRKREYEMRHPKPQTPKRDVYCGLDHGDLIEAWGANADGEATPEQHALIDEYFARGGHVIHLG